MLYATVNGTVDGNNTKVSHNLVCFTIGMMDIIFPCTFIDSGLEYHIESTYWTL